METLFYKREMQRSNVSELPRIGYVCVHEGGEFIAAGFLRRIEGNIGWFDGLISNPEATGVVRNEALDTIVESLVEHAKKLKIKRIIAHTVDESIEVRSKRHKFRSLPHKLIALNLEV